MSTFLVMCPYHRDYREIKRLPVSQNHSFIFHEYLSDVVEEVTAPEARIHSIESDINSEIDSIITQYKHRGIDGVFSTDDYPGSTLASIVAYHYELPGVAPQVNLLCQHKYYGRKAQHNHVPDAVPQFTLFDISTPLSVFPFFLKPIKSFFSVGASPIVSEVALTKALALMPPPTFFEPFTKLCKRYASFDVDELYLLAEELLHGDQVTVEGYVYNHDVVVLGVVDSIMFDDKISFARFDYPSHLPLSIQERMSVIAEKVIKGIKFNNGLFNIEMIYNPERDTMHIIEINPRMSSQFADLFEKVDGINSYEVLMDIAVGKEPHKKRRCGKYACASSCILRTFKNYYVAAIPTQENVAYIETRYPDIRIEVLTTAGIKLSQQMQDGRSYRYGMINIGGQNRQDIADIFAWCSKELKFTLIPL